MNNVDSRKDQGEWNIELDAIGPWSEIKLEIVETYARVYSKILTRQKDKFRISYIDGFCGAGIHTSKHDSSRTILGSPTVVLSVRPAFDEYHFVDANQRKLAFLRGLVGDRPDVWYHHGDCNEILPGSLFRRVRYGDYQRAFCLLDPYALQLDWRVIQAAAATRAIDVLLNFPVEAMNRNVLRRDPTTVSLQSRQRMTSFWGDDSWNAYAYKSVQGLFWNELEKQETSEVLNAYLERLRASAGFKFVAEPLPMVNSKRAVVYYLVFASCNPVARKVMTDILKKYRLR